MPEILSLIFALLFAYLCWQRLDWGVMLIALFLPTYVVRLKFGPLPTTLLELLLLALFFSFALHWLTNQRFKLNFNGWLPWLLLFIGSSAVAVFVAPNIWPALGLWRAYILEPVIFFLIFINVIKKEAALKGIFNALGLSLLAISLVAIWQKFSPEGLAGFWAIPNPFWAAAETRRVTSIYGFPNAVGLFAAPIITLHFGLLIKAWRRWGSVGWHLLIIISGSLALVLAVSEGAIIAAIAGSIVIGLALPRSRRTMATLAVGLTILTLSLPATRDLIREKIFFKDQSGQLRLEIWQETWQLIKHRPILGAGLNGYQTAVAPWHQKDYIEIYLYPHNIFLNFWVELGLAGLISILLIIGRALLMLIRARSDLAMIILGVFITWFIHGLVDVPYFKNDLSVLFWIMTASASLMFVINKKTPVPR